MIEDKIFLHRFYMRHSLWFLFGEYGGNKWDGLDIKKAKKGRRSTLLISEAHHSIKIYASSPCS